MAVLRAGINISDICLINHNLPLSWRRKLSLKRNCKFRIIVKHGSEIKTSTKRRAIRKYDLDNNCVFWNEPLELIDGLTEDTLLMFTIVRTHPFTPDNTIGSCEYRVTDLLKMQNNSGPCKLDIGQKYQLTFRIEKLPAVMLEVVEEASAGSATLPNLEVPAEISDLISSAVQVYNDNEKTWTSFINTFQGFMRAVDDVSEISLYVKVAWSILSVIPKTIIAKRNRDDKVRQLCEKLKDIYDYIMDAKRLRELTTTQTKTLSAVVRQTTECAYFIQAYSTEHTVKNLVNGIGGSVDRKIQGFNDKLDRLMSAMRDLVNLETSIVTLRVLEETSQQTGLALLNDMYYSGALPLPGKRCLLGTRRTLIDEVLKFINDGASPQILVVSGQAGVGKTAVAHTIAGMFKEQNRLGSMFCFDRGFPNRRKCLFSTISRDLADGDTLWRRELLKIICNTAVRKNEDPETQFEELIVKPSKNVDTIGPVVIVMDALDESGDRNEREKILEIIFRRWSELPKNYCIILTTRPEQDIEAQCREFNIPCKRIGDIDAEETFRDIQAYVSKRLEKISPKLDEITGNWCNVLAKRAEGLFQWAQTACQFIDPTITRSQLIKKNWETCVSNSSLSLYGLYRQIISSQSESQDAEFIEEFKTIIGAIITAREPLSIDALQNIIKDIEDIRSILTPFGSFFFGVHDMSSPVRPVHTSLFDFFVSKNIAEEINEYYIDTSNEGLMTLACLKSMNGTLCFNICGLETSHLRNQDVPNFSSRVEKAVPSYLSYSCRFWTSHLQCSIHSKELVCEIRKLMDDGLLYYFEALSLLNAVDRGCAAMQELVHWCKNVDDDLAADAMDAWEFGFDFGDIMTESTPHLYLSALPFVSHNSFVSKKYLRAYPGLLTFDCDIDQPLSSSRQVGILRRQASAGIPNKLAFSPKGRYVAAGSNQGEFWVWDYITGERVVSEVRSKTGKNDYDPRELGVCDTVFSPDGELVYCCFYYGDILILKMATKEISIESIKSYNGMTCANCNFCTISSDGCFIAWCTAEGGALILDRKTHRTVKHFANGLYTSVSLSPNGEWVALYRHFEQNLSIWNTRKQTEDVVCHWHDAWWGLALTDVYIAFQNDASIEIWELRTNVKITEIQHETNIGCLHLSPDNQYILFTSDETYSIWSVPTGELISRSYVDEFTCCLGFSHDSRSIALRTFDGTIDVRQWDRFIELDHPNGEEISRVDEFWLRGKYLILRYTTILYELHLQISDNTTRNTVVLDVKLDSESVSVFLDEENVRVGYITRYGLCLWDAKEGEIVIDGPHVLTTTLLCMDKYLITVNRGTITLWDSCTRTLIRDPIYFPYIVEYLLPVRGCRFAIVYGSRAEIWECKSGGRLVLAFRAKLSSSPVTFSANEKHIICISRDGVDTLDPTGARVSSIAFSSHDPEIRLSLDRRYLSWIDNGEIKLFDVDTETMLTGPSLNQEIERLWFSDDSNRIIILSRDTSKDTGFLDIWDIQSKDAVMKTIRYPKFSPGKNGTLALNNQCMVDLVHCSSQCSVWDLKTYEIMSRLYYSAPPPAAADASDSDDGTLLSHKAEILDYALMAWKKASLPAVAEMNNGWVLSSQGELLFWVPEDRRERFWYPCTMHMPHRNITKLDFEYFVHGSTWTKCRYKDE